MGEFDEHGQTWGLEGTSSMGCVFEVVSTFGRLSSWALNLIAFC